MGRSVNELGLLCAVCETQNGDLLVDSRRICDGCAQFDLPLQEQCDLATADLEDAWQSASAGNHRTALGWAEDAVRRLKLACAIEDQRDAAHDLREYRQGFR